ncbi:hypothetical protein U9M48_001478 [Paspalum notatum var. saurae]|uniref:Uncharacterized protein n=1 Tax=Paspalum notatum var. saurae TaxID=547442 RepID=A0AAQ3PIE3_PASNO
MSRVPSPLVRLILDSRHRISRSRRWAPIWAPVRCPQPLHGSAPWRRRRANPPTALPATSCQPVSKVPAVPVKRSASRLFILSIWHSLPDADLTFLRKTGIRQGFDFQQMSSSLPKDTAQDEAVLKMLLYIENVLQFRSELRFYMLYKPLNMIKEASLQT